jgi:uncharacterized protein YbjT (DUF2867 family)
VRVLVTGASGVVGRHVVDGLRERGVDVRVATRSPSRDDAVRFAFGESATYGPALEDVDRVFLIRPGNVTRVGRDVVPFVDRMVDAGVERVAYVSVLGADRNPLLPHARIERALDASSLDAVHLRPSWFAQNLATFHRPEVRGGDLFVPAGDASVVPVDTRDVARAAVAVLTGDGPFREGYALTGPETLDFDAMAATLSDVLDREVRYTAPSFLAFARHMRRVRGLDREFVLAMCGIYLTVRLGFVGEPTDDYRALTGEAPTPFREFAEDHREVWA